jgi:hypothetical protein
MLASLAFMIIPETLDFVSHNRLRWVIGASPLCGCSGVSSSVAIPLTPPAYYYTILLDKVI